MTNTKFENIAIVILAAGGSSRFGGPKQLLLYNGKSLLLHAVDTALETGCRSVIVVVGANSDIMRNELNGKPVVIPENNLWREGMASSIRCGLENMISLFPGTDHVIFMVCDQPYVNSSLLIKLAGKAQETGMPIVASNYGDQLGTPALFHKNFFSELMELKGDKGAQILIMNSLEKVASVPFPEGIKDIDTVLDYELLNKGN